MIEDKKSKLQSCPFFKLITIKTLQDTQIGRIIQRKGSWKKIQEGIVNNKWKANG
jgi:hypothetical protein